MTDASFNRLFNGGALNADAAAIPALRSLQRIRLDHALDDDGVRGKLGRGAGSEGGSPPSLSKGLDKRLGASRRFGLRERGDGAAAFDPRQRAVVKLHYFGHGGGGAAALRAHGRYIARDGAARSELEETRAEPERQDGDTRAHAAYLSRDRPHAAPFYDALGEDVDGASRLSVWARNDCRHFRIILSAENGAELDDLKTYTRAIMERAEAALGTRLEWVAIDHHDTDNPHTHIVLRGRRQDGRMLILPRAFVQQGLRELAKDVATERLGARSRDDERRALAREAVAHRPARLDYHLARAIDANGQLRLADLKAQGDPALRAALKLRARELQRLGLADETRRNVLSFRGDWREQLTRMEMHLDIRKRVVRERTADPLSKLLRGPER